MGFDPKEIVGYLDYVAMYTININYLLILRDYNALWKYNTNVRIS